MSSKTELVKLEAGSEYFSAAAEILKNEWPAAGSIETRLKRLQPTNSACSYVLLVVENGVKVVIGHGRLQEAAEMINGIAGAVTSLVIAKTHKGKGFGRILLTCLEDEARAMGYCYMYLWTTDAVGFYLKCRYMRTSKVNLSKPALKKLTTESIQGIEAIFSKRLKMMNADNKSDTIEGLGGDDSSSLDNVWLRKRLLEKLPSHPWTTETRLKEIKNSIELTIKKSLEKKTSWGVFVSKMAWQQQVGPSCGLAALRIVKEYFLSLQSEEQQQQQPSTAPSLLQTAVDRGFSHEGEIFDINNLNCLATEICLLKTEVLSHDKIEEKNQFGQRILNSILNNEVILFPYDRDGAHFPSLNKGHSAHYCVLLGIALALTKDANVTETGDHDEENINLIEVSNKIATENLDSLKSDSDLNIDDHVLIIALHSGSSQLIVAPLSTFLDSNLQLVEPKPGDENISNWVTDNMNLKGRAVAVSALNSE